MAQLNATAQNDEESSSTSSFAMADVVNAICGIISKSPDGSFGDLLTNPLPSTGTNPNYP
jgi:hypothetical protein